MYEFQTRKAHLLVDLRKHPLQALGRDAVNIELNPEYVAMQRTRIEGDAGLFAQVTQVAAE